jgi:diguanylate cyclase (GGDEF)-like protein
MRGGDAVLSEVARRLGAACREVSTAPKLVTGQLARTGGDEFTLAVQGAPDRDEAARIASRLVEMLAKPVPFEGTEVDIRVSVGVACAPEDGGVDTLQTHGEAALRAAKERGGGVYALFDEAREQLDLLHDLRRAIDERRLELFYQPKIDAQSGQVTAAEALLRWNHPTRGMVSPAVFIPLAERYGLIRALGDWVIDDACRQARVWRKAGLKMRVAINLSAHQMRDEGLIDRILEALARHGIDPSRLTCEITETVAMEDTQVTQNTFELLGEAGIHLSIDDFGTGQSSLAYLRRLPAAELKIDRAFVKDLGASDEARAIVNAIVQLAHALGKRVVAEGVETVRQRDVLLELGCDEWQGFLFAKPMSARALQMWALDDRRDQNAFRPSLFADTNTPTRFVAPERGPRQVEPARAAVPER